MVNTLYVYFALSMIDDAA